MLDNEATGEQFVRFHGRYGEVVGESFDALEFAEDDFYAFQVLDRAFRSDDQELRRLAAHLQLQREAALETITVKATEILEQTKRMKTLELKVLERIEAKDAVATGDIDIELGAGGEGGTPAAANAGTPERRKGWFR